MGTVEDTAEVILKAFFILALIIGVGSCRKWQYNECLEVGHSDTYCMAQAVGCVGGRR